MGSWLMADEMSDFDALIAFRNLHTDAERLEALFLQQRSSTREARWAKEEAGRTTVKVTEQNGRIGRLERWQTGMVAVLAFVVGVAPFVFFALNWVAAREM
jgi:hypothetical protein